MSFYSFYSIIARLLLVGLGFAVPAVGQQVWKVYHAGGPGVHFTDLPAAVAAAAPNDEIWVYSPITANNYDYTACVIDKPLRIVGFRPGSSPSFTGTTRASFRGLFVILGIPAGERVSLSNLNLTQNNADPAGVVALDCGGDIILEDWFSDGRGVNYHWHFENCANVVIRGCELYMRGSPLRVVDSNLLLSATAVGYDPPQGVWPFLSYTQSTETVSLERSTANIIGSSISGIGFLNSCGCNNQPAVRLEDSTMVVGPDTILRGGLFSVFPLVRQLAYYAFVGNNIITIDSRAIVDVMPTATPGPTLEDVPSVFHSRLVAGSPYAVVVAGPRNGFAVLATGDYAQYPQVTPLGALALSPTNIAYSGILPLSSTNGYTQMLLQCPTIAPVAHAFAFQAITLAPDGAIALTVPSPCTVGWENGRVP